MKRLNDIERFVLKNEAVLGKDEELKALDLIDRASTVQGFLSLGEITKLNAYEDIVGCLKQALDSMKDYRDVIWKEHNAENLEAHKIYSDLNDIYLGYIDKYESEISLKEIGFGVKRKSSKRVWIPKILTGSKVSND